jgi:Domain of unknown function (DUF4915)
MPKSGTNRLATTPVVRMPEFAIAASVPDGPLERHGAEARCGLLVIDLRSGDTVHWVRLEGVVQELYDVVFLPGVKRPSAIGFKSDSIRRVITVGSSMQC